MIGRPSVAVRDHLSLRLFACVLVLTVSVACRSPAPDMPEDRGIRLDDGGGVVVPTGSPVWERLRIEPVRAERWNEPLELPGRVQSDPRRVWRVMLPVPGRVLDVHVSAGESVRAGQPLLTMASPEADTARAAVRHAGADRRAADAAVRQAQADLERQRDLLEHDAVSRRDVLHAETSLAQAEADQARAGAALAQARDTLAVLGASPGTGESHLVVRAPRAGRVMEVAVAPGEFHADTSSALLQIADLTTVWLVSDVPEHRLASVRTGEDVEVTFVAFPGERFTGRIARVGNALDADTRSLKLYAELPNRDGRLRPEMFATIRVLGAARDVPVVPADAVVRAGTGAVVVVADGDNGRFVSRQVRVGRQQSGRVAILEGLEPGERVVVDGALLLVNAGLRLPTGSAGTWRSDGHVPASRIARRREMVVEDM
jgi:cobalt-zinc-cadmium efflux system membrane fusion protein